MVYLNRHVAVNLPNWIQLACLSVVVFFFCFFLGGWGGGGVGVRVGHVRSRLSLEYEFKRLV